MEIYGTELFSLSIFLADLFLHYWAWFISSPIVIFYQCHKTSGRNQIKLFEQTDSKCHIIVTVFRKMPLSYSPLLASTLSLITWVDQPSVWFLKNWLSKKLRPFKEKYNHACICYFDLMVYALWEPLAIQVGGFFYLFLISLMQEVLKINQLHVYHINTYKITLGESKISGESRLSLMLICAREAYQRSTTLSLWLKLIPLVCTIDTFLLSSVRQYWVFR